MALTTNFHKNDQLSNRPIQLGERPAALNTLLKKDENEVYFTSFSNWRMSQIDVS